MKSWIVLFMAVFFWADYASAQGHFVRHGFHVGATSYSQTANREKLGFGVGYHIREIIELGVGLERVSDSRTDIVTLSWVPFAAYYPLVQSDSVPFTLRLGAAYETQSLSGDPIVVLEEQGLQSEGSAYRLEVGASRRMDVDWRVFGRPVALVPILSFSSD